MSVTGSQAHEQSKRDRTTLQYDHITSKMLYYDAKFHGRSKVQQLRELVRADIKRYKIEIPPQSEPVWKDDIQEAQKDD